MRLVLVYGDRPYQSWLRILDDVDGHALLALHSAGWVPYSANLSSYAPKELIKICFQPGVKDEDETVEKIGPEDGRKNIRNLKKAMAIHGFTVEGPRQFWR